MANQSPQALGNVGSNLLGIFAGAALVVVAAVWLLGEVGGWWLLAPVFVVYLLASTLVMWSVFHTMSVGEEPAEKPQTPAPPRASLSARRRTAQSGRLLPH
jgi:UDP-N-acetylmuramyl pentapeptide phosphotransferase/UDP-N-acetylglucosamine-1-phosphate transferase